MERKRPVQEDTHVAKRRRPSIVEEPTEDIEESLTEKPSFDFFAFLIKKTQRSSSQDIENVIRDLSISEQWKTEIIEDTNETIEVYITPNRKISESDAFELSYEYKKHPQVIDEEPLFRNMSLPFNEELREEVTETAREREPAAFKIRLEDYLEKEVRRQDKSDWALEAMNIKDAWNMCPSKGSGIRIGHPDTGYTLHPELRDAINKDLARDFHDANGDGHAKKGWHLLPGGWTHGTATASVIVSKDHEPEGNYQPVTGVAPEAELVPLRTNHAVIYPSWSSLIRAIDYARSIDCNIISMSLGGLRSPALERAINRAYQDGIVLVAAAGNYVRLIVYPAAYDQVIAVAASNVDGRPWIHSSRGTKISVTAPGEHIWRATWHYDIDTVEPSDGTSYAAAHVAGICALWLSYHKLPELKKKYGNLIPQVFHQIISDPKNCTPVKHGNSNLFGGGIIDARKVLEYPLPDIPNSRLWAMKSVKSAPLLITNENYSLGSLQLLYPEIPPTHLKEAISNALHLDLSKEDDWLSNYGAELAFHLASNVEGRKRFGRVLTLSSQPQLLKAEHPPVEALKAPSAVDMGEEGLCCLMELGNLSSTFKHEVSKLLHQ